MDRLLKPGHLIFAIGMLALGGLCLISKDFIIGRPPAWPAGFEVNPVLAYISGVAMILAAFAIIFNKKSGLAALLMAVLVFSLSVLRHLPQFMNDWGNAYKALALFGGTLIIATSFFGEEDHIISGFHLTARLRKNLVITGCVLLAAFFIACGYAHFRFAAFVHAFIPDYIPFHAFWTYFCGLCLFAGGIGLLLPQTRRWAALLSGIMILGWFILLHIPRFVANTNDVSDRMGLCESFTFVGIFFVLAGTLSVKE